MADISDVETALRDRIAALLYPGGTGQPSAVTAPCRVFRGWPQSDALDTDLANGTLQVSIYPRSGSRNTTRALGQRMEIATAAAGLSVSASVPQVTFTGAPDATQVVAVEVDGMSAYNIRPTTGQTTAQLAAAFAAAISADRPANAVGSVLTVTDAIRLLARVVVDGSAIREQRRQEQILQVTFWCPTPALRDAACALVDGALASVRFLDLADGTQARIRWVGSVSDDGAQRERLYRRDILYAVEFATVTSESYPRVASVSESFAASVGPNDVTTPVFNLSL